MGSSFLKGTNIDPTCPIARFLGALDGPWATLIVRELLVQPRRFGELRTALGGVSPKTLTDRLRRMEQFGILQRDVATGSPISVTYRLTDAGRELRAVFDSITVWSEAHLPVSAARPPRPKTTPRRLT